MRIPDSLYSLVDHGIIEEVVRPLMSGKEAQVYLVVSGGEQRVAKIYKEAQNRTFQNRADYTEGRKVRNSRDQRAMSKGSRHGRAQNEAAWRSTEVDMIYRLRQAGVRVPVPHHFIDGVLIMELVCDAEGFPAPRLGDLVWEPEDAVKVYEQLLGEVVRMLSVGVVHGDLSDFNVLMAADGPVIIDFPQSVDASSNQNARKLLLRDVANLQRFLGKFAPERPAPPYAEEMWELYKRNALTPDTRLTGRYRAAQKPASTDAVMGLIVDAARDERRRREHHGLSMRGARDLDAGPREGERHAGRGPQAQQGRGGDPRREQRAVNAQAGSSQEGRADTRGAPPAARGRERGGQGGARGAERGQAGRRHVAERGGEPRERRAAADAQGQARSGREDAHGRGRGEGDDAGGDRARAVRDARGGPQQAAFRGDPPDARRADARGDSTREWRGDQRGGQQVAGIAGARSAGRGDQPDARRADARGDRAREWRGAEAREQRGPAQGQQRAADAQGGQPQRQAQPSRGDDRRRGGADARAPRPSQEPRGAAQARPDLRGGDARQGRAAQHEARPQHDDFRASRLEPRGTAQAAASNGYTREGGDHATHDAARRSSLPRREEQRARGQQGAQGRQAPELRSSQSESGARQGLRSDGPRFERAEAEHAGLRGQGARAPLPDSALGSFTERPPSSFGERMPRGRESSAPDDRTSRRGTERDGQGRSTPPRNSARPEHATRRERGDS